MKRTIGASCAAVLLALLLVTPANAGVKLFTGTVAGGGEVSFQVNFKRGKPKVMGFIEATGVPVQCADGPTTVRFSHSALDVKVRKRKFVYRFSSFKAKFKGKFNKKGKKATGILDYGPNDLDSSLGCDTNGPRKWKASK
jgi:hypothetical protein